MILCRPIVPQLTNIYTRRVGFLASKEVRSSTSHLSVWIHVISKDSTQNEPQEQYTQRSLNQYAQMMQPTLGDRHTELAFIHLSTSSERPDLGSASSDAAKMYGGHIVLALARQRGKQLSIVPDGYMSKGFNHLKPLFEKPKDARIMGSDGQIKILKGEDYQREATFHNEETIKRFLASHVQPKKAIEFGSKQFLVIFPLAVLGLTINQVMRNIMGYKEDPIRGTIYDRMNDACTHAVVASLGITKRIRGLTTQRAVMEIAQIIKDHDENLYLNFLDNALVLGLSFEPDEVYNNLKEKHETNKSAIQPCKP